MGKRAATILTGMVALGAAVAGCGGRMVEDVGGGSGATTGASAAVGGQAGGATEGSGSGVDAGAFVYEPAADSCASMTGTECNGESCCASIVVPGGTFPMGRGTEECDGCTDGCPSAMWRGCLSNEQPEHPATISGFALDKYEVTVGRFRAFVEAGGGTQVNPPAAGSGAHPLIADSGWSSAWNTSLPADRAGLVANVKCLSTGETWTDTAGDNEQYPMNCVDWYVAFAFCIWDGGRLPTEAEWEYAAAGGDENRVHPWGGDVREPLPANYHYNHASPYLAVGSEPNGNGRWGHADLAGSMSEWMRDSYASDYYTTTEAGCADCADLATGTTRVIRSGDWNISAYALRAAIRDGQDSSGLHTSFGWRCARNGP